MLFKIGSSVTVSNVFIRVHQTGIDHTVHRDFSRKSGTGKGAENGNRSERFLKHISILYENSFSTGSREHALTYDKLKVVRPRAPLSLRLSYLFSHFTKA